MAGKSSHLARYLALAYALLIAYASLHPLTGWRESGAGVFDFLLAPWPRYYTVFDVSMNAVAYLPFGFVLVPALRPQLKPGWAALAALVLAAGWSISLEAAQTFMASRVPSNLDVAANALGGTLGACAGLIWGGMLTDGGALTRWRMRRIVRGHTGDIGLVLLALWWLAQLDPDQVLFGLGDLRGLFGFEPPVDFTANRFRAVQAGAAACAMVAVGVLGWHSMRARSPWLLLAAFIAALSIKSASGAVLAPGGTWYWLTPGSLIGLAAGATVLGLALVLPRWLQYALGAMALLAGVALVNLAPENPYPSAVADAWRAGHFFNFSGLTRLAAAVWPYVALPYLMNLQATRH